MTTPLAESSVTHAHLHPHPHPTLNVDITAESAVRYLCFFRPVRLSHLDLPRAVCSRWTPRVPAHPPHLIISTLGPGRQWRTVREVDLPYDPRTAGEGLSQALTAEAMDAHFARILADPPYRLDLDGLETDHLRVECDREHLCWPNHGECQGAPHLVPFGILNPLVAFGEAESDALPLTPYRPLLRVGTVKPAAPRGMSVRDLPDRILFQGRRLAVGFSLRRPLLLHLGWDVVGGEAGHNRLADSRAQLPGPAGLSGPVLRTFDLDTNATLWTGHVEVHGNRVVYRDLEGCDGLRLDATFTVEPDRLTLELAQHCDAPRPYLEAEAWRLAFNLRQGITGAAALPTLRPGRNGEVHLPAFWTADRGGCLACRLLDGEPDEARLQVESFNPWSVVTGGFVLAPRAAVGECDVLPAGTRRATFGLAVRNFEPAAPEGVRLSPAVRRHWATVFSCFRPEFRGFSNHAASVNCHLSQGPPIDVAAFTRRPAGGPDPLALARFTVERALLDGGGYGACRNLYLDSDPVLVSAAGRCYQADPDVAWLRRIAPGLAAAVERIAGEIGDEGLVTCRDLSGNRGSYRWSSNGMDVVGFGHFDAYVNAWAYRALRSAAAMCAALERRAEADECRARAEALRAAYAPQLVNPATGWVAGWRSRDGELHDYAFLFVNGPALAFGLLDPPAARRALRGLERLRDEVGPGDARMGPPLNLLPIDPADQMLGRIRGGLQPTFETYTDGSLCAQAATYYLRALSIYGLRGRARRLARELAAGYDAGVFNGGSGSGVEFRSWEGLPTGYEGTLVGCFGPLYAIAVEQGALVPPEPEWWPAD